MAKAKQDTKVETIRPAVVRNPEVPTYTLRGDDQFDLQALIYRARLARFEGDREQISHLEAVIREFEMCLDGLEK